MDGLFVGQDLPHKVPVELQGPHGAAVGGFHHAADKPHHLGAGPADVHEEPIGEVQLLHGPGIAEGGLLLAGDDLDGVARGSLNGSDCLVRIFHIAQRGRGKHCHGFDVQCAQRRAEGE